MLFQIKLEEMRLFLIGFMGAGKSALGKKLAPAINAQFYDLDDWIEEKAGKTIPEIFDEDGETAFRKLEAERLRSFQGMDNCIIATGGGTPCFQGNMEWMNRHGITVFLEVSVTELANRLRNDNTLRPLLKGMKSQDLTSFIKRKLAQRQKYYDQAHFALKANDPIAQVLKSMINYFARFG